MSTPYRGELDDLSELLSMAARLWTMNDCLPVHPEPGTARSSGATKTWRGAASGTDAAPRTGPSMHEEIHQQQDARRHAENPCDEVLAHRASDGWGGIEILDVAGIGNDGIQPRPDVGQRAKARRLGDDRLPAVRKSGPHLRLQSGSCDRSGTAASAARASA